MKTVQDHWRRASRGALYTSPTITDAGVLLGYGTVLVHRSREGYAADADAERFLCLLSVAQKRPQSPATLHHLCRALASWQQGRSQAFRRRGIRQVDQNVRAPLSGRRPQIQSEDQMIDDASYWMKAQWGARVETPAALASRLLRTMDHLRRLSPQFDDWEWCDAQELWDSEGEDGIYPFAEIKANLVHAIERNAGTEDDGTPDPFNGYLMASQTKDKVGLTASASHGTRGGFDFTPFVNRAEFELPRRPDPRLVDFDLLRNVFLVLNEIWEATWAEASPAGIRPYWDGYPVRLAWMSYVSPHYAPLMTPPASAIVERRSNGGLFLAATRDVFEVTNPAHLAVAREIEAALQPLNAVPNPNDAPYY